MNKFIIFGIISIIIFGSCDTSKKIEKVLLKDNISSFSLQKSGDFVGEILDKNHRKKTSKITLEADTNRYRLDSDNDRYSGSFSWVDENKTIIELNGLAQNYPNRFRVTSGAIIQMLNGNTLQDSDGNNQFVLALQ